MEPAKAGVIPGGVFGVTLMLWICIRFDMFPPNAPATIRFLFGLGRAVSGRAAWRLRREEGR